MVCYFSLKKKSKVLLYYFAFLSRTLQELKVEENNIDQKEVISLNFNNRTEGPLFPFQQANSRLIENDTKVLLSLSRPSPLQTKSTISLWSSSY